MDNGIYIPSFYDDSDFEEYIDTGEEFRYLSITHDDMLNGEGLRVVLWVSGCSHECPGCQNAYSWDPDFGLTFDYSAKAELFEYLSKPYTTGITFSGGDPLFARNRIAIGNLITEVKKVFPDKDIWLYTGYELHCDGLQWSFREVAPWKEWHDEFSFPALSLIDVVVDRPFMANVRKADVKAGHDPEWCGSSNQRVIDVKKSLAENKLVCI